MLPKALYNLALIEDKKAYLEIRSQNCSQGSNQTIKLMSTEMQTPTSEPVFVPSASWGTYHAARNIPNRKVEAALKPGSGRVPNASKARGACIVPTEYLLFPSLPWISVIPGSS